MFRTPRLLKMKTAGGGWLLPEALFGKQNLRHAHGDSIEQTKRRAKHGKAHYRDVLHSGCLH
jgi:hypothetical protein